MNDILRDLDLKSGQFDNEVVLVTGGARGIGAVAVRFLSSLGAKVVLADIARQGQDIVDQVNALGADALFVHTDLSCLESIDHLVDSALQKYGSQFVDGYLPIHEYGIINIDADTPLPVSEYGELPDPRQELGKLVRTNIEIEKRVKDRTSRLEVEKDLLHKKSHTDALTGLPNRLLLNDRLQQAIAAARRHEGRSALMFIDLDEFKPVNDAFGHHAGDLLLKKAAKRMQSCLRESDTIARVGGDEFIVLLPIIKSAQDGRAVAEKIRNVLAQTFDLSGRSARISSSIGVAIYPEHGGDGKTLLRNADAAMYIAKRSGRNNVQLHQVATPE